MNAKHLVLSILAVGMAAGAFSQSLEWEENFESYQSEDFLETQSADWYDWDGAVSDGFVSSDFSFSGSNSLKSWDNPSTSSSSQTNSLHEFNVDSGHWKIILNTYLPSGSGGFFGLLHDIFPEVDQSLFFLLGECSGYEGFYAADNQSPIPTAAISYLFDQWVEIVIEINFDEDSVFVSYDGAQIHEGQWSVPSGNLNLSALNIASPSFIPSSVCYFDDIQLWDMNGVSQEESWSCVAESCVDPGNGSGIYSSLSDCEEFCGNVNVNEELESKFKIYPNPVLDELQLNRGGEVILLSTVTIFDITGKKVLERKLDTPTIDVSTFEEGMYFLEATINNQKEIIRFVKN